MPITVSEQAHVFLYAVIGGMLIAFIYDLFRIKRKAVRTSAIVIYLEDFIYWIIVAIVMFAVVYYSNDGEIRGYIFIGTAVGTVLYALLLSKIIVNSSIFVLGLLKKTFTVVWRVVTYPFRIILKIMSIPAGFLYKFAGRTVKKTRQVGRARMAKAALWKKIFRNRIKKI